MTIFVVFCSTGKSDMTVIIIAVAVLALAAITAVIGFLVCRKKKRETADRFSVFLYFPVASKSVSNNNKCLLLFETDVEAHNQFI